MLALVVLVLEWGRDLPTWTVMVSVVVLAAAVLSGVHHAEVVAHRVGEPFGTLVLALAVTAIESSLIVSVMLAGGEDPKVAAMVSQLAVEPLDGEPTPEYAEHVWARLEEFRLKTLSDAMRLRLQKLNPTSDPDYDQLFMELVTVDGNLRRLRQAERDPV